MAVPSRGSNFLLDVIDIFSLDLFYEKHRKITIELLHILFCVIQLIIFIADNWDASQKINRVKLFYLLISLAQFSADSIAPLNFIATATVLRIKLVRVYMGGSGKRKLEIQFILCDLFTSQCHTGESCISMFYANKTGFRWYQEKRKNRRSFHRKGINSHTNLLNNDAVT